MEPLTIMRLMKHPTLAGLVFVRLWGYVARTVNYIFWAFVGLFQTRGMAPAVIDGQSGNLTPVDSFWGRHTVVGYQLAIVNTAKQSSEYVNWRSAQYPLFEELMGLWDDHKGQTVLDYGCGPGTDLVGFVTRSNARHIIGMDISPKALGFASRRLALHHVEPGRVNLIRTSDSATNIPLPSASIDFLYSLGVVHHTSNPAAILREFRRVLKPGCEARVMIYNEDSLYYHLYVAYELKVLQGMYKGMSDLEAFTHTTDTNTCPYARCYTPEAFSALCSKAGFDVQYRGGYFSKVELGLLSTLSTIVR